jgi:hypothetical protein
MDCVAMVFCRKMLWIPGLEFTRFAYVNRWWIKSWILDPGTQIQKPGIRQNWEMWMSSEITIPIYSNAFMYTWNGSLFSTTIVSWLLVCHIESSTNSWQTPPRLLDRVYSSSHRQVLAESRHLFSPLLVCCVALHPCSISQRLSEEQRSPSARDRLSLSNLWS